MKKNYLTVISLFVSVFLFVAGCQKEIKNQPVSQSTSGENTALHDGNNSSCKLTHNAWGNAFTWDFHYNNKGLADEWKIDFGNNNVQDFKMKYDKSDKLKEAEGYDAYNNLIYTTSFSYSGQQIIKQTWTDVLAGTTTETLFTHNSKGQIVREDGSDDTHEFQTYDNMGNCTRSNYYIGSDLYFSDNYEFKVPVKDPLLTVSGIDFMFPYSGIGYFNKLWFSRNLSIVYDGDGNASVINDLDASKKDFNAGHQNFPISVNYYDTVSASSFDFTFGYSCNWNNIISNSASSQSNSTIGINKSVIPPGPILRIGSGRSIKEQLQELRQQLKNAKH